MRYQDKAYMASGVEMRVPYLDHELVDLVFSAPASLNLRGGETKAVLRRMYSAFDVRDNSKDQRKLYVATPQREWIKYDFKDQIMDCLNHSILEAEGIMDTKLLKKKYLDYCESKDLGNSFFIWKFLSLELWFKTFMI